MSVAFSNSPPAIIVPPIVTRLSNIAIPITRLCYIPTAFSFAFGYAYIILPIVLITFGSPTSQSCFLIRKACVYHFPLLVLQAILLE
jgi:hypothetical protein